MDASRGHESQCSERALIAYGELGGNPAAEGGADEMDLLEPQSFDEVEVEVGEVADIVEPLGRLREAESRVLRNDQFEIPGQDVHERKPATCTPRAVQVKKRLTGTRALHAHPAAGDPLYRVPQIGHVLLAGPGIW